MTLISVVLGHPSMAARDADTLALLGYGFAGFLTDDARARRERVARLRRARPHRRATPR